MGMTNNPYLLSKKAEVHYTLREYDLGNVVYININRLDLKILNSYYSNICLISNINNTKQKVFL